jgi:diketogulonate reductase-like aldo/keto reductase
MHDFHLSSKTTIPQLGFGTWLNKKEKDCKNAVRDALEVGYRHFDTAQAYKNEQFIGSVLAESNVPRNELFLTTKILTENMWWDDIIPSFEESLEKLQTDYVDLLLIHFPVTELRRPAWRRLEDIYQAGMAKAIGVSNYTARHLEELLAECNIKPAVNQVEAHVFLQQPELVAFCKKQEIAIEAYSPLVHGYVKGDKVLKRIAEKYNKTQAQVMIRWCLDQGFIVLPKATSREHIEENFNVFDFKLNPEDLKNIEGLDADLRTCWDPTRVP